MKGEAAVAILVFVLFEQKDIGFNFNFGF